MRDCTQHESTPSLQGLEVTPHFKRQERDRYSRVSTAETAPQRFSLERYSKWMQGVSGAAGLPTRRQSCRSRPASVPAEGEGEASQEPNVQCCENCRARRGCSFHFTPQNRHWGWQGRMHAHKGAQGQTQGTGKEKRPVPSACATGRFGICRAVLRILCFVTSDI